MNTHADRALPLVAVVCDQVSNDGVLLNTVRSRYCEALRETAVVAPVLLPTGGDTKTIREVMNRVDGLLLTGSNSNVDPCRYGKTVFLSDLQQDKERDALAFFAIEYCLLYNKPLLGICRGLQEINVFFGGTLHQDLAILKGYLKHTEDETLPRDIQYKAAHSVRLSTDGLLRQIFKTEEIEVNSLHRQGIDRLGNGLTAEAWSPDGLIEAISINQTNVLSFGVQWHPEWHHKTDTTSKTLLQAFGKACSSYKG